jgi:Protein of unknown function (DUF2818)
VSSSVAAWTLVLLAFCAANLPFVSQRLMAVVPLKSPKTAWLRLAELLVFYFVVGGIGLLLEQRMGQIAPQKWEFYAITGALFITFAFPGFVYRYLFKHSA